MPRLKPNRLTLSPVTAFCFLATFFASLAGTAQVAAQTIVEFDAPGSAGVTVPVQINLEGSIAGYYADDSGVYHGFLRGPGGHFTTFSVKGAGKVADVGDGTLPTAINVAGVVAGYYNDKNLVSHGFLRWPDGKIETFNAPGADLKPADKEGTTVSGINDLGAVSGNYVDASGVSHGYLRSSSGKITGFEAPGSGGYGTFAVGPLNLEGAITGYYTDSNFLFHGFVRSADGKFKTFVGPDSCLGGVSVGCYGTGAYNINIFGTAAGAFEDNGGNFASHGFVRTAGGKITVFEAPGAGTGAYQGTGFNQVAGLNDEGAVSATYLDANNVYHGYLRDPDGKIVTFDAPDADLTPGSYSGTFPESLNDLGTIAGYFYDAAGMAHGFIRIPDGAVW